MCNNAMTNDDDFDVEFDSEPVDELYENAVHFAKLASARNVSAKSQRMYARLADLFDRAWLAKGSQGEVRIMEAHTALLQIEKVAGSSAHATQTH